MALNTYSALQTSMAKWLWRTGDTDTEAYIPDMIVLAEAHFNRKLRVSDMDAVSASLTVTDGVATQPTGFRSVRSIRETGTDHDQIKPKPIDEIERYSDLTTGQLQFYARVGAELHFWPRVSTTVRLRYREEIPALTDSNTSNWLLAKHPDLYLHTALASGEAFNMNDSRVAMWKALAMQAEAEVQDEDSGFHDDGLAMSPSVSVAV